MLQRDLLCGNSGLNGRQLSRATPAYNPCIGSFERNCSRQPVPCGNFKFKLKLPPGLTAVVRLLRAGVSLCKRFYCIPTFLFCGAAVAPQSRCLPRPVLTQLKTASMYQHQVALNELIFTLIYTEFLVVIYMFNEGPVCYHYEKRNLPKLKKSWADHYV